MTHPGMLPKVLQCEQKIGYQFTDQNLCWEALQHAGNGVSQAGTRFILNGNKRLAILGDMVLATVLSKEWYNSGDSQASWDAARQKVMSNPSLAKVGLSRQLETCVHLGSGQGAVSDKMMATAVEALIGAVHLDSGEGNYAAVKGVMDHLGIAYQASTV